ncbi:MAG: bifunctional adenosylcobinamide kinase/adenosylcobinamide-phosphate guanylyltransferase [Actinobacteria bacterium HGW-Actinobacteria-10]|jgi:adenosylcobinamide kinase/adenosylcobinamide-phosphate guanylyltransferase|nr:MAG: bifunctional adenosylcobinamide kinase/adenosylcobinamide-phosphate guanylyltransferase [Actinobacteria bacterium HGW-Actinobacteria-10]
MSLVVLTGGSRSGKSNVAVALAQECAGEVSFVGFAHTDNDREMKRRVEMHRSTRPAEWHTIEARDSVEWTLRVGDGVLLIDCLGTLLGLVMSEVYAESDAGAFNDSRDVPLEFEAEVERRFAALVGWILRRWDHTIVVTNEVGEGVVPAHASGRVFRDVLGRANRSLVDRADAAYLVVAGRCIDLTEYPQSARWPTSKGCK